jgi:hypothetical protein
MSKAEAGRLGAMASKASANRARYERILAYDSNPKRCPQCGVPHLYERRQRVCCSHSCAAKYRGVGGDNGKRSRFECRNCAASLSMTENRHYCSMACKATFFEAETIRLMASGHCADDRAKAFLIKKHGQVCMDPECAWNHVKRPLRVELDHRDGNSRDNRLENVRLLCPNCHSLTPTYKSKNRGNGRPLRAKRYRNAQWTLPD